MKIESQTLLRKRAIEMAVEPEQKKDSSTIIEFIVFVLADESFGVESAFVREVCPLKDYTILPGTPSFILGIINVRGQILSVVDLKKFFHLPEKGLGELNKVIILRNDQMEFGILADEVIGIRIIFKDDILPVPLAVNGISEKYLKGVTKDGLIILSAVNLLSDKNMIINEE